MITTCFQLGAIAAAICFIVVIVQSARAILAVYGAYVALIALAHEIGRARQGTDERYVTRMPNARLFEEALETCDFIFDTLDRRQRRLLHPRLGRFFTTAWRQECFDLVKEARTAIDKLRLAAFWAQFPDGSPVSQRRRGINRFHSPRPPLLI